MTWRAENWAKDVGSELALSLDNFECDDKKPPTLAMAVKEAEYIINLHYEAGTTSSQMLSGELGDEERNTALTNMRECRAFMRKYRHKI